MSAAADRARLRAFRAGWTAFVVLATSAPYVLNLLSAPAGTHYTWIVPPYPEDSLAYRAWSQQAVHGSLLFQLKYTALPHAPFLFHPFFLICGWIGSLFACDIGVVHWVVKGVGVALFLAAFYRYTDFLRLSDLQSMVASVLVGVSSGFGGLAALLGLDNGSPAFSADLWVVDSNTYWSLLWNPLFPYSLTLMLVAIHCLDRGTREGRRSDLWRSGLATGAMVLIHPYSQPLLFALTLIITLLRRRVEAVGYLLRYALAVLPFALYVDLVAMLHPLASRHSARGEMLSPALPAYLLGFGLPLLLGAVGLIVRRSALASNLSSVLLWFALSVSLSYFPLWFQRKLIFGAHVPLCVVAGAAAGLMLPHPPWSRTRAAILGATMGVCLFVLTATPIYLLVGEFREVRANSDGAYYIGDDLMEGLRFLRETSKPSAVVFATVSTSRLIPAYSGNTVVWGHWAMSIDRAEREKWWAGLFKNRPDWDDPNRSREFWGSGIDYILADPRLSAWIRQRPDAWRVILADGEQVFANASVVIYRHRKVAAARRSDQGEGAVDGTP